MRAPHVLLGLLLVAAGAFWILMLYGFATTTDPGQPGVPGKSSPLAIAAGEGSFPIALVVILGGVYLLLSNPRGKIGEGPNTGREAAASPPNRGPSR